MNEDKNKFNNDIPLFLQIFNKRLHLFACMCMTRLIPYFLSLKLDISNYLLPINNGEHYFTKADLTFLYYFTVQYLQPCTKCDYLNNKLTFASSFPGTCFRIP